MKKCKLCDKAITAAEEKDMFCYGCGQHVCEECSVNISLMGPHDVEDHLNEDFEDE